MLEGFRGSETIGTSAAWPLAQALAASVALWLAWRRREQLRLRPVLGLGLALQLGWIALHLALGVQGDGDPLNVYRIEGESLLHGTYPHSEYPPAAVALFTLEAALGRGAPTTPNAFLMVPFQLLCVWGIWSLRTRWSPFLAAFVALWPLDAYYWQFRFDLVPTGLLVAGLLLAVRGSWYESGFALGLGACVKWTPGLAAIAILLWLARTRQARQLVTALVGMLIPVLVANLPVLLWDRSAFVAAYTRQDARTVTAESAPYLVLRLVSHARPEYWYFGAARNVSRFENTLVVLVQVVCVLLVIGLAALATSRVAAVALAGLAPAAFLLGNRIFSPQFFVLVVAVLAVAAALVAERELEVLLLAAACAVSTTANTILYQSLLGAHMVVGAYHGWTFISAAAFVPVAALILWLAFRAFDRWPAAPRRGRALRAAPSGADP